MGIERKTAIKGVRRNEKIAMASRRDDPRTFLQRISDNCSTPDGTMKVFGFIIMLQLFGSVIPFLPEFLFLISVGLLIGNYRLSEHRWSASFRMPKYLNKQLGRKIYDATTDSVAEANLYLGHDTETNEQVWANTSDLNKHALMIGTTGSGKTENIMGNAFGYMALGSGLLMVDGKASVDTYGSVYKIARLFGRDDDLHVIDYLTGGRDIIGPQKERRSHGYNPLGSGGASMKAEIMISLMDTGNSGTDVWAGRAMSFMEALIPPLSYLAEEGHMLLNPGILSEYFMLSNLENLAFHGVFENLNGKLIDLPKVRPEHWRQLDKRLEALRVYLENLPSYAMCKPDKVVKPRTMTKEAFKEFEEFERVAKKTNFQSSSPEAEPQNSEQARQKVEEQHGYITMQLVRAVLNLSVNYGYIYNKEISELDYSDIVLNRRILIVLLPALERSDANLEQLGKLTVLSLKAVLGSLLNTDAEGLKRKIIDGNPSKSKIPFAAVLDEVGYYMVKGIAVIPAQARSLGVALTFGTQDIPSLKKASPDEGNAILDNTAAKFFGRLTSAENSDTALAAIRMGGKSNVQSAESFEYQSDLVAGGLRQEAGSTLKEVDTIDYDDLAQQENGEFHFVVGSKSLDRFGRRVGGNAIIRLLAFYTGGIPAVENWVRNPYCAVKPLAPQDIPEVRNAEIIRREAAKGYVEALQKLRETRLVHDDTFAILEVDIVGKYLKMRESMLNDDGTVSAQDIRDFTISFLRSKRVKVRKDLSRERRSTVLDFLQTMPRTDLAHKTTALNVYDDLVEASERAKPHTIRDVSNDARKLLLETA